MQCTITPNLLHFVLGFFAAPKYPVLVFAKRFAGWCRWHPCCLCATYSAAQAGQPLGCRVSQCSSAYAAYGFFATTSRTSSHTLYSYRSYILIHDIYRQSHKYSTMLHYIVRVIHASATSSLHLHWVWSLFYAYYPLSDMFWCTPKLQTLIRASMS